MSVHSAHSTVIRVSRGTFDPRRHDDVQRMVEQTGSFMVPAIKKLSGFIVYFAGVSPLGALTHISLWQSEQHASHLSHIPEMADAKLANDSVGVQLQPVVNYPIVWHVRPDSHGPQDQHAPAVIRIARGVFDPARYGEAVRMFEVTGSYLMPAVKKLPGMIHYYAGIARSGSGAHISLWDSAAQAEQIGNLREIKIDARGAAAAVGARMAESEIYSVVWSARPDAHQPAAHGASHAPSHAVTHAPAHKVGAHRP